MKVIHENNEFTFTGVTRNEIEIILNGIVALKNNHIPHDPQFTDSRKTCVDMANEIENQLID